ncbi:D-2-hydroxyacid dehydrogenase [Castellaniella sp.]|uniref:D-2-hydroxyacid dehydrogenase n=1 Tax=Castellaniella sp. TaxID=1955812 RepID=UPI00355E0FC7
MPEPESGAARQAENGVILSVTHGGQARKVWVYRPRDADLFVAEAEKRVAVEAIEPLTDAAFGEVTCAVGWLYPLDVLEKFIEIQWVQSTSSGLDHLQGFARRHPGVALTAMRGLNADVVAEYALAQVLGLRWRTLTYHRQAQQRVWRGYKVPDISSTAALIIGMGNIGQQIARHLSTLGMRVLALRRQAKPCAHVDQVLDFGQLHMALGQADYVILSLPLTAETRYLIGAPELAAMKPGGYLINLSRGGIVDEAALAQALQRADIAGAVLDVTETEPYPPEGPLWGAPNLLITPHVAGEHADFARRAARHWAENLRRFLAQGAAAFQPVR